ncbi:MAG: aspartate--ammonia ligase [Bacteroidales bacterium]|nr:aspartate--ammonia ligase [Bacteroidales bacterium]
MLDTSATAVKSATTEFLQTEEEISFVKERFCKRLMQALDLVRVSAPLAVLDNTGLNDDLNGVEKPISFSIKAMGGQKASVVQSLAKWKRVRLKDFGIQPGKGIVTDMRAMRPDDIMDNIHSVYVDQWDWEKVIVPEQRTVSYLKSTVNKIYDAVKATAEDVSFMYPEFKYDLPEDIYFIHSEELLNRYPNLSPKQREEEITKEYGAVFIIGIGGALSNGEVHDGRAPDYDDWSTPNEDGYFGLNGDILLWNSVIEQPFEISSMGIRVDKKSLEKQLAIRGCENRKSLMFHKMLLNDELPLSIGGGIGQSRMCMYYLKKNHICEVQSSMWPPEMGKGYSML